MSSSQHRRHPLLKCVLLLLTLLLAVCLYAGWDAWRFLHEAPESPGIGKIVDIEPGSNLVDVSLLLQKEGRHHQRETLPDTGKTDGAESQPPGRAISGQYGLLPVRFLISL